MATWIAHMRIAEHFMNIDGQLNNVDFLVGNIAPDCGVPKDGGGGYVPDRSITHWNINNGKGRDSEGFRKKYVKRGSGDFSFYLGYYFHLLTDSAWKYSPLKGIKIVDSIMELDEGLTWEEIKRDWYGQDCLFLRDNPGFIFFTAFQHIKDYPNRFFDFFPRDAFSWQIKNIIKFYAADDGDTVRGFSYLSKSDMDSFVNSTIFSLENIYQDI